MSAIELEIIQRMLDELTEEQLVSRRWVDGEWRYCLTPKGKKEAKKYLRSKA